MADIRNMFTIEAIWNEKKTALNSVLPPPARKAVRAKSVVRREHASRPAAD
jgi:hypothetical protein